MENKYFEQIRPSREKLDAAWYDKFKECGSFQAYEYFDGDKQYREAQKKDFLEGKIENPVLDYPKLDLANLEQQEQKLRNLRREVKNNEINPTVNQLYRWKINEKIAEVEMLQATATGKTRNFKRYNEFVYGKPSPEIFAYTIQSLKSKAEKYLESDDSEIKNAARELVDSLPEIEAVNQNFSLPRKAEVQLAQENTLQEVGKLLNIEEIRESYQAEEIKEVFEQALDKLKSEGWEVVIDKSSKTGISVDQEKMQVKVPQSREVLFKKLQTLVAHEIGTHVARRANGERSKLMLLGLGLDRYEKGEEGLATMREQAIGGKVKDFSGPEAHLAISLASGLDGKPRNFREVYTIMVKNFLFKHLAAGKNIKEAREKAEEDAWNRCVRTFRGTDCKTPGVCFTKDIVYREGNIGVWDVVGKNPEEMMRFNVGKYDPANPRHIWIMTQLGITEKDLEELEED